MKKITKALPIAVLSSAFLFSSAAFAAIPDNTAIVDTDAFALELVDSGYGLAVDAIIGNMDAGEPIYVKLGTDNILDLDGMPVSKDVLPAVTYYDAEGNTTRYAEKDGQEIVEENELKVESVSAINGTEVEVVITALEEDLLGATIEVIDNEGNVVEVKPTDIAAGDTVVFFEFVETQTELEGVWTVAGIEFDLDLAAKLEAFVDADTQLKLNAALQDLEIENVVAANLPNYLAAKDDFLAELEDEVTRDDIQTFINDVNTEVEESGTEAEQKEAALEAVVDALEANNDVLLLQALQNDLFVRVNDEWLGDKASGYKGKFYTDYTNTNDLDGIDTLTFDGVQAVINTVNDAEIADKLNALASAGDFPNNDIDSVDVEDLQEAKALIISYATLDDEGKYVDTDMETALEQIELQLAVADVLDATTPNTLKARLTALDALDDEMDNDLDMDEYIHDNARAYLDGFDDDAGNKADGLDTLQNNVTVANIQTVITNVNTAIENSLIAAVTGAANADALFAALNELGVKQVAATNEDAYYVFDGDASLTADYAEVTTKADAQALVDAVNVDEVQNATASTIIEKLNVFGLDNVVAANAEAYFADANGDIAAITADATGDNDATVQAVEAAVDAVNDDVIIAQAVEDINVATTAEEVKVALDTLANKGEVSDYLNVTTVDRIFIAEQVLEARADETNEEYADATAVGAAVTAATNARTGTLIAANALAIDDALTDIADVLLLVGHESLTGEAGSVAVDGTVTPGSPTANDTAIADAFITSLEFDDSGAITPQFRSIAEIRAAIDAVVQ